MFTGLIEEIGVVQQVERGEKSARLTIRARKVLEDSKVGDSIAVNGVCLTVTSCSHGTYTADVMNETMERTNLSRLRGGEPVNLERALALGDRFGGHLVSGHIDGTGRIIRKIKQGIADIFTIQVETGLLPLLAVKGSITIDGVSLTVTKVQSNQVSVSLIPHTIGNTILQDKQTGSNVNIECDLIARYLLRMTEFQRIEREKRE